DGPGAARGPREELRDRPRDDQREASHDARDPRAHRDRDRAPDRYLRGVPPRLTYQIEKTTSAATMTRNVGGATSLSPVRPYAMHAPIEPRIGPPTSTRPIARTPRGVPGACSARFAETTPPSARIARRSWSRRG